MGKNIADIVIYRESIAEVIEYSPDAEKIISGNPAQKAENYYTDESGQFSTGIWHSEPGKVKINYTEDEYCMLTKGLVELTDAAGISRRFKPGDNFVIPAGFQGTWETIEPASKFYVIYEIK